VKATEVTASLAESNCSLLPGLWRDSLHVTCGLTACTPKSVTSMGKLYLFNHLIVPSTKQVSARSLSGRHRALGFSRRELRQTDRQGGRAAVVMGIPTDPWGFYGDFLWEFSNGVVRGLSSRREPQGPEPPRRGDRQTFLIRVRPRGVDLPFGEGVNSGPACSVGMDAGPLADSFIPTS